GRHVAHSSATVAVARDAQHGAQWWDSTTLIDGTVGIAESGSELHATPGRIDPEALVPGRRGGERVHPHPLHDLPGHGVVGVSALRRHLDDLGRRAKRDRAMFEIEPLAGYALGHAEHLVADLLSMTGSCRSADGEGFDAPNSWSRSIRRLSR